MKSILFAVMMAAAATAFAEDSSSAGVSTNRTVTAGTNDTAAVKTPQKKADAVSGATWKKRKPQ